MSEEQLSLQVGGTLNPRKHIYIQRPEDEKLLDLLKQGQFCNVLSPRQMGKSSLMARTVYCLRATGINAVSIDLAGDLGKPENPQDWYLDLMGKIERDLGLGLDIEAWWRDQKAKTSSQRLMRFFGEELPRRLRSSLVVFLDEIDSTLRLPYADDLFLSLRALNNDRALEKSYEKVTFCLLGVATPNELIKSQTATSYNVGQTLELRDFDQDRDDLSPLRRYLSREEKTGGALLRRVLYWTGGQPYLTTKLCKQLVDAGVTDAAGVDAFTQEMLSDWERLGSDVHFQQIERFIGTRASDEAATLELYERIRARELDKGTQAHIELRLSGLVKRGEDGILIVRNRIYERVFDPEWIQKNKPVAPPEPKPEAAYRVLARDVRRFAYPAYAISMFLAVVTVLLAIYARERISELTSPQASVLVQPLSNPGAVRSARSEEPVIVPAGISYFVIDLLVDGSPTFPEYEIELMGDGGGVIWHSKKLQLSSSDSITLGLSRSFLPAGKYQIRLYGIPTSGKAQVVADYPMPLVYAE